MKTETFLIQAGDILAIRGAKWLSKGILLAEERQLGVEDALVSHVGMFTSDHPFLQVTEALTRVRTRPVDVSISNAAAAYAIQAPLDPVQRINVVRAMLDFSANGYNWGDIGLQLLDATFRTTFFTDKLSRLDGRPICSYAVAAAFYKSLGWDFGQSDRTTTPADVIFHAIKQSWPIMQLR